MSKAEEQTLKRALLKSEIRSRLKGIRIAKRAVKVVAYAPFWVGAWALEGHGDINIRNSFAVRDSQFLADLGSLASAWLERSSKTREASMTII